MELEILEIAVKVAGLGGLAIGAIVIIFKTVTTKDIFSKLNKSQSYALLLWILVLSVLIAIVAISAWVYVSVSIPEENKSTDNIEEVSSNSPAADKASTEQIAQADKASHSDSSLPSEAIEKPNVIQVIKEPSNIATIDQGSVIQQDYNLLPNKNLNLNVIIDNKKNTVLKVRKSLLKDLRYTIEFPKQYSVSYISFYQPENRQSRHYLKEVYLKGVYLNGAYSEPISIQLGKDQGFVGKKLDFKHPIKAILINPFDSYSYHEVFLGDVRVYAKE